MKPLTKAIVVTLIQGVLVSSLGAKLLYDRSARPRAWFRAERYDPNLPIRGRYLNLQLEVNDPRPLEEIEKKYKSQFGAAERRAAAPALPSFLNFGWECGSIDVSSGTPLAVFDQSSAPGGCDNVSFVRQKNGEKLILRLAEPVLFFIPDTAQDPTHLASGEELWVLATIPRKGPPRPIALGIKKVGDTAVTPLNLD
jgi:hypothetical protein